jgi:hypothetical protein
VGAAVRVYILSDHGEYGAENVFATLDKDSVPALLDGMMEPNYMLRETCLANLKELLESGELHAESGENLSPGWGGYQLHVVELA